MGGRARHAGPDLGLAGVVTDPELAIPYIATFNAFPMGDLQIVFQS